ncbi:MAG: zinc ribbon domain-containing protein [Firmicutes bacterium]|nr:zinc ribbon domain-containing protein [Bacillota bacterium]
MGLFFNNKKQQKNTYLDDQKLVFETSGDGQKKVEDNSYDEYTFKKKEYPPVPKYKAFDENKVNVVIDKEAINYQDLKPEVATVNLQKTDLYEDLNEIVNNAPIDDNSKELHTSIYDESLSNKLNANDPIEVIELDDNKEVTVSEVVEQNLDIDKKLSIFGKHDEPIQARVYEVKETPEVPKIEIIDVEFDSVKKEDQSIIKLNENGKKVCPQCGAPCEPSASNCFLCGNKF